MGAVLFIIVIFGVILVVMLGVVINQQLGKIMAIFTEVNTHLWEIRRRMASQAHSFEDELLPSIKSTSTKIEALLTKANTNLWDIERCMDRHVHSIESALSDLKWTFERRN